MNQIETFQNFLATQSTQVPILTFSANILLTALLSTLLGYIYIHYGKSLSNRRLFARNFLLLSMTTMFIIAIVKSSLALSLGLVGALSIVRFRAAIKSPEELAYLFFVIGIGLGLGADQTVITIIAFIIVVTLIYIRHFFTPHENHNHLYLTVSSDNPKKTPLTEIITVLKKHCKQVDIKRVDDTQESLEAAFYLDLTSFENLNKSTEEIKKLDPSIKITFLDNKNLN